MVEPSQQYDEDYYRSYLTGIGSIAYERNTHWLTFFGGVAEEIARRLRPTTALDAGCALGILVECLVEEGIDARGIDVSRYAIETAHESIRDRVQVGSLTEPIDGRYDLVTCIEVIEHLDAADAPVALKHLTAITDQILLSTTPADFAEPTHYNVRPPEYWAELLAGFGFHRDLEFDASFLSPWAALYRRRELQMPEVVRSYERETWRLRRERDELRHALADSPTSASAQQLSAAVEELRHDLRRAVDAVHAAEAERATATSRLRHVEYALNVAKEREKEFVDLVAKIDEEAATARHAFEQLHASRSFRLFDLVMRGYRRIRP